MKTFIETLQSIPPLIQAYLLALICCYVLFWWGTVSIFKNTDAVGAKRIFWFRILSWFTCYYSLYDIYKNANSLILLAVVFALVFLIISQILFLTTAVYVRNKKFSKIFNQTAPKQYFSSGPFRFIRHPFYSSYIFCYLSLILIRPVSILTMFVVVILVYYFQAAKSEEQNFLKSDLSEDYSVYQNRTGMFFPRFW